MDRSFLVRADKFTDNLQLSSSAVFLRLISLGFHHKILSQSNSCILCMCMDYGCHSSLLPTFHTTWSSQSALLKPMASLTSFLHLLFGLPFFLLSTGTQLYIVFFGHLLCPIFSDCPYHLSRLYSIVSTIYPCVSIVSLFNAF